MGMQDELGCIFVEYMYVYMLARRLLKGKCHSSFKMFCTAHCFCGLGEENPLGALWVSYPVFYYAQEADFVYREFLYPNSAHRTVFIVREINSEKTVFTRNLYHQCLSAPPSPRDVIMASCLVCDAGS